MTKQVDCPYCGEYSGLPESVAGHAQGKRDDPHSGVTYPDVMERLAEADGEDTTDTTDEPDEANSGETEPDTSTTAGPLDFPEADRDTGTDGPPDECPDCGGDLRVLPAGASFVTDDGRQGTTDDGDAQCTECEGVVTVDGEVIH